MTENHDLLYQAANRKHVFVGEGPCYYCGVLKQNAEFDLCSLDAPPTPRRA